jgi:hypothetical protein
MSADPPNAGTTRSQPDTQEIRRMIEEAIEKAIAPLRDAIKSLERVLIDGDEDMDAPPLRVRMKRAEDRLDRLEARHQRLFWGSVGAGVAVAILGGIWTVLGAEAVGTILEALQEIRKQLP